LGTLLIGTGKGRVSPLPFLTGSTSSSLLTRLIISIFSPFSSRFGKKIDEDASLLPASA
jgi:hypothetical protein